MATGSAKGSSKPGSASRHVPHIRIENEDMIKEKYEFGRQIGEGSFGVVYEVRNKQDEQRWACKSIQKDKVGHQYLY